MTTEAATAAPEPAAAPQTTEVDRGPVPAESDAQRALREAQEALAAATAVAVPLEAHATSIAADLQTTLTEHARLDALHELAADEAHAQEHARRRVRKLEGELTSALGAVEAAKQAQQAAERVVSEARLAVLDAELKKLDIAFVAGARAGKAWFTEMRGRIRTMLDEANLLDRSLQPHPEHFNWGARGVLSGIGPEQTDGLVAAAEVIDRLATVKREIAAAVNGNCLGQAYRHHLDAV